MISDRLHEEDVNIGNLYIDGTCNQKVRNNRIDDFKTNAAITCLLATYRVGGVGLNLVSANNVILADMWWNPSVEDQAIDRTHRLGQEKEVNVYKLIVKNTIEEKILKLQDKKKHLRDNVIDGKSDDREIDLNMLREILV